MKFRRAALVWVILMSGAQAQAQTQLEMNQSAADEASQAKQKVDKQVRTLATTYAKTKGFKAKLDEAQELWNNFVEAHIETIFPVPKGQDYRMLYGSVNGMCLGKVRKELAEVRLAELKAWTKPASKKDLTALKAEYEKADKLLNTTYRKVVRTPIKVEGAGPTFLKNLVKAEVAWIAFRNTDSDIYGLSLDSPEARYQKMIDLTNSRTKQLNQWVEGTEEGDVCGGSFPLKK